MGCRHSAPTAPQGTESSSQSSPHPAKKGGLFSRFQSTRDPNALEKRMQAALKKIIEHKTGGHDDTQASFNRIILKFPAVRVSRKGGRQGCSSTDGVAEARYRASSTGGHCFLLLSNSRHHCVPSLVSLQPFAASLPHPSPCREPSPPLGMCLTPLMWTRVAQSMLGSSACAWLLWEPSSVRRTW